MQPGKRQSLYVTLQTTVAHTKEIDQSYDDDNV